VGYCYPSGLEKTLCKWDVYVPLVTKGLNNLNDPVLNVLRDNCGVMRKGFEVAVQ